MLIPSIVIRRIYIQKIANSSVLNHILYLFKLFINTFTIFSILHIEVQRRICEVQINFFLHSIFLSETSFPQFPLRIFS